MMNTTTAKITILLISFFIISCAGAPQQIPLETLVQEANGRVGEPITLGGYILDTQTVGEKIYMTVLQAPLGSRGRPRSENTSEGNFLVAYGGKLDLNDYGRRRQVTVRGKIAGIAKEEVADCPAPCLKIDSSDVKVWAEEYRGRFWGRSVQVLGGPH